MNEQPLVSIIIPCFNVQDYLVQCVESVQKQSYANVEIILINDGSVDKTHVLCDQLAQGDPRIVVLHTENNGVSQARNYGLELARGEYVMFIDGDDWTDLDTCQAAVQAACRNKADIVIWSYIREFAGKSKPKPILGTESKYFNCEQVKYLQRRIIGLTGTELSNPEHADSLVTVWGKLYRREILDDIQFVDMSEVGTEDVLYNTFVFGKATSAYYIPDCFHHYRKTNKNSLSTAYTRKIFNRWKNLYVRIQEYIERNNLPESFCLALSNRICLGLIGLGTNLAQSHEPIKEKFRELKLVLCDPVYQKAINRLELCYFPIKWKLFFFFAKHCCVLCLYLMLCVINYLRRN